MGIAARSTTSMFIIHTRNILLHTLVLITLYELGALFLLLRNP
jgi:hypothetical protein